MRAVQCGFVFGWTRKPVTAVHEAFYVVAARARAGAGGGCERGSIRRAAPAVEPGHDDDEGFVARFPDALIGDWTWDFGKINGGKVLDAVDPKAEAVAI